MSSNQVKIISPLRYPGGKVSAIKKHIIPLLPNFTGNYYEPFIGGGSVALAIAQLYPNKKIYINDIDPHLINFWKVLKGSSSRMITVLEKIIKDHKQRTRDKGRKLFKFHQNRLYQKKTSALDRAVSYYILNKISFSGLYNSFSYYNYERKLTLTNVKKLRFISSLMKNFVISNRDFFSLRISCGRNNFIYLDPPYMIKSTLYGPSGKHHKHFNHQRFAKMIKSCKAKWLISYNNNAELRKLYKDFTIIKRSYTYCLSVRSGESHEKKQELFIKNY